MISDKPSVNIFDINTEYKSSYTGRNIRFLKDIKITPAPTLDISNNKLISLRDIPEPQIIKILSAANNELAVIEEDPLRYLTILAFLDLSFNHIKKIENVFFLPRLHSLNLAENEIEVIENLEGAVCLRQLNLSNNNIHSIFVRSPLPKLVSLDLSGNQLRLLHGISSFPCLSTLLVNNCKLSNLSGLKYLLNLRTLCASCNTIGDFPAFFLPLLTYIDLSYNNITTLEPFTKFNELVSIDVSGNPIENVGLQIDGVFPDLKEFRANFTDISCISPIISIAPNIVVLSITSSRLNRMDDITNFVANATKLQYLDIRVCPININLYPDIKNNRAELPEYSSEEAYDRRYPQYINQRHKYRETIVNSSNGKLVWLDGIKIPGRESDAAAAIPPSRVTFIYVDETAIEISSDPGTSLEPIVNPHRTQTPANYDRSKRVDQSLQVSPERFNRRGGNINDRGDLYNRDLDDDDYGRGTRGRGFIGSKAFGNIARNLGPGRDLIDDDEYGGNNGYGRDAEGDDGFGGKTRRRFANDEDDLYDQEYQEDNNNRPMGGMFKGDIPLYPDNIRRLPIEVYGDDDSGPGEADALRICSERPFDFGPPGMPPDDVWDKYSCGTDASSQIGGTFRPQDIRVKIPRVSSIRGAKTEDYFAANRGCSFWVPHTQQKNPDLSKYLNYHIQLTRENRQKQNKADRNKKAETQQNYKPFRSLPPQKTEGESWPFNTKCPRKLPWDFSTQPIKKEDTLGRKNRQTK